MHKHHTFQAVSWVVTASLLIVALSLSGCSGHHLRRTNYLLPQLRSISKTDASKLAAYVRRIQIQADNSVIPPRNSSSTSAEVSSNREPAENSTPKGIAWSMINWCCQERALILQYAIASAPKDFSGTPPIIKAADITDEAIDKLIKNPTVDTGIISITGPLFTEQTIIDPQGKPVAGDTFKIYWSYHHGIVINVEGTFSVMDLSVSDQPIPIALWVRSFLPPDVPCSLLSIPDYQDDWAYWLSAFSNWETGTRPTQYCGYIVTPPFRFRWDQDPLVSALRDAVSTMDVQTDGFKGILKSDHNVDAKDDELALYTSKYQAHTEKELNDWMHFAYWDKK